MDKKQKSGLHKQVSSIFNGVPLPNNGENKPIISDAKAINDKNGHIPPRPSVSPKPPEITLEGHKEDIQKSITKTIERDISNRLIHDKNHFTCSKCKILKHKNCFNKNRTRWNGLQSFCRDCQ